MLLVFRILLAVLFLVIGLTGCGVTDPFDPTYDTPFAGTLKNEADDNTALGIKIQHMIEASYPKSAATVVLCDHFNVLVAGEVNSQATKDKIGDMIKAIPSVKDYHDYMTIQAIKPKLYDNATATKAAQLRINNENNISLEHVKVVVVAGVAYVMGNIKPNQTKNMNNALEGIYSVEGVNQVINLTKVTPYDDTGKTF
jgi:osmotically-inducible protein OsmY